MHAHSFCKGNSLLNWIPNPTLLILTGIQKITFCIIPSSKHSNLLLEAPSRTFLLVIPRDRERGRERERESEEKRSYQESRTYNNPARVCNKLKEASEKYGTDEEKCEELQDGGPVKNGRKEKE